MSIIKIAMLAVTGVTLALIIKQWKSDLLPLLRIALTLLFATLILGAASPLVEYIRALTDDGSIGEYTSVLLDALGIAVLSEICASICRESGENGIAVGVETAGKIEILLLSLPLMNKLLAMAEELLSLGGAT